MGDRVPEKMVFIIYWNKPQTSIPSDTQTRLMAQKYADHESLPCIQISCSMNNSNFLKIILSSISGSAMSILSEAVIGVLPR